jgi:hypothetical protein
MMGSAVRSASGGHYLTSVARIADFAERPISTQSRSRIDWADGDYVVADVTGGTPFLIESPSGRYVEVLEGDSLVGALGRRCATLEVVGDWRAVSDDLMMHTLTSAGVLGRCTSAAPPPRMATLRYQGHVMRDGRAWAMRDFVAPPAAAELRAPVVLIIGTSMDAGKTVAATRIVRELKGMGLRVAASKLTGVGRLKDLRAMADAGADAIADFVDAGLPSTAVQAAEFEPALRWILGRLAEIEPDVVVAEAGASPLEPYNGETAVQLLGDLRRCTVLCASDPYAVVGVMGAFEVTPDLISGRATSTEAAIALLAQLCPVPALNLLDPASRPVLRRILEERLGNRDRGSAGVTSTAVGEPDPGGAVGGRTVSP